MRKRKSRGWQLRISPRTRTANREKETHARRKSEFKHIRILIIFEQIRFEMISAVVYRIREWSAKIRIADSGLVGGVSS